MENIVALRKNFADQLQQTNTEVSTLQNQLKMLELKREQLKGAIYALDAVTQEVQQSAQVTETKTETQEG